MTKKNNKLNVLTRKHIFCTDLKRQYQLQLCGGRILQSPPPPLRCTTGRHVTAFGKEILDLSKTFLWEITVLSFNKSMVPYKKNSKKTLVLLGVQFGIAPNFHSQFSKKGLTLSNWHPDNSDTPLGRGYVWWNNNWPHFPKRRNKHEFSIRNGFATSSNFVKN